MLYSSLFFICSVSSGLSVCFFLLFRNFELISWGLHLVCTRVMPSDSPSANTRAKFLLSGTRCLHPEQIARSQLSSPQCTWGHISCVSYQFKHFSSLRQVCFFHWMFDRKTDPTLITDHQMLLSTTGARMCKRIRSPVTSCMLSPQKGKNRLWLYRGSICQTTRLQEVEQTTNKRKTVLHNLAPHNLVWQRIKIHVKEIWALKIKSQLNTFHFGGICCLDLGPSAEPSQLFPPVSLESCCLWWTVVKALLLWGGLNMWIV